MASEPEQIAAGRPLEGPGSDARLRRLRRRFSAFHARLDRSRRPPALRLASLCLAIFVAIVVGGLLILR